MSLPSSLGPMSLTHSWLDSIRTLGALGRVQGDLGFAKTIVMLSNEKTWAGKGGEGLVHWPQLCLPN